MSQLSTAGARFRAAVAEEQPLQVIGAITAYAGLMAKRVGYKALYLSGGGVAANSLGVPDLGISTMEDVLTDARRIVDATQMPLLVDIDTGWGGAFNIGRTVRSFINVGVAAVHMEDQVGQKRCGHRPGKEVVSKGEMVDRVKAAVDARTDSSFVIMARTDAAAVEGIDSAIERAVAYVEAGADMIFPEAMKTLDDYRRFKAAVKVPILANLTEFGSTPFFTTDELKSADVDIALYCCGAYRAMNKAALNFYETRAPRRHAEERRRHAADARGPVRLPRLSRLRRKARQLVRQRQVGRLKRMSSADAPQTTNGARARNWDALAALIAALIGVLALLVSGYTAYIQRQQVRAQVWPYLLVGNYDPERAIGVLNKGVGPAIVGSVQVFVDGKPQRTWKQVFAALGLPDRGLRDIHDQRQRDQRRRTRRRAHACG